MASCDDDWKTQQQIDEEAQLKACSKPDIPDTCEQYCQGEAGGIGTPDGMPFCNETGKPSIAIDFGGSAELRDGSKKKPINLRGIQRFVGIKFKSLMAVKDDGTLMAISPPAHDNCEYKLVATRSGFEFRKNTTKNEFDPDTIYSGDQPDFVVGGKITSNECGDSVMRLAIYDISTLLDDLQVNSCK